MLCFSSQGCLRILGEIMGYHLTIPAIRYIITNTYIRISQYPKVAILKKSIA